MKREIEIVKLQGRFSTSKLAVARNSCRCWLSLETRASSLCSNISGFRCRLYKPGWIGTVEMFFQLVLHEASQPGFG